MILASSLPRFRAGRRIRAPGLAWVCALSGLSVGLLAGWLTLGGNTLALLGLEIVVLPLLLWRWPAAGVILVAFATTLLEQNPLPPGLGAIGTDEIHLFTSLSDGIGLRGILISPLELTMVAMAVVVLARASVDRRLTLPRSPLAAGVAVLFGFVLVAWVIGHLHGGDFRESLRELRPWVYLGGFYVLASQLVTGRRALQGLLWALVIGSGIKGVQGTARFLALLDVHPTPDYILSHEEALFFGLYSLVTAALWIFGRPGRLRAVATGLLPAVLVANLANNRRTSWLILMAGFAALLAVAWIRLPNRRQLVKRVTIAVACVSLVYFPLFWNNTGLLSQPARAIRSAVSPNERDSSSNEYRVFEDANLAVDIQRSTPFGTGFGIPIDYSAVPFYALTLTTPSLRFEPHNGTLYVWLRLGTLGALAFWFVIGAALIAASELVRSRDQELAMFAAIVICAVIAYVVEGNYDIGLEWFRVASCIGCLLGALEAARRMSPTSGRARASSGGPPAVQAAAAALSARAR